MNISEELLEEARNLIGQNERIVITNHMNPDGDAMGSALALQEILLALGKDSTVVVPNSYPEFLKWLEGSDNVVVYEEEASRGKQLLKDAELIIHLDYNNLKRSGSMQEPLAHQSAKRMVIDHHQQPDDFADVLISDSTMSSTCEMIFHFIERLDWVQHLSKGGAEALYTGLITDTGNFRFSSTTAETHRVAGEMLKLGVQSQKVASRIYDTNTPQRLGLLSRALERMEIVPETATALITLSESDLQEFNYQRGDTEGFVNYGLSLLGIELSIFAYPHDGLVKISFRSKTDFDVNQFARTHFNGGGHKNAAGAASHSSLENTVKKIKNALRSYEDALPTL